MMDGLCSSVTVSTFVVKVSLIGVSVRFKNKNLFNGSIPQVCLM